MSFGRSASGPGGLTLNTGAANSLFGSTASSQPPAPGGLFGSTQPQPSTNLFGASTATSQPQQTGGLFGSSTTQGGSLFGGVNTSQPQQGDGLFGTTTTQPQQQQQGGGLFGSSTTQSQSGGGLFGGAAQQQPQQSGGLFGGGTQQQQQGGGLFGGQNQQQNQQSSGLFGGANQQQGQQGGGLFGGASTNKPTMSLFGTPASQGQQNHTSRPSVFTGLNTGLNTSTNTTATQQRPSLFSTTFPSTTSTQNTTLGGSSIGGNNAPLGGILGSTLQQQTQPGVKIDLANIRGTTRFSDLHEDLQKVIEKLDSEIVKQMETHKRVEAVMPGHEQSLSYIPNDVEFVSRRLATMQQALENDAQAIDRVRRSVKRDYHDAQLSFRALNNLKLPPQYQYTGLWSGPGASTQVAPQSAAGLGGEGLGDEEEGSTDLVAYFSRQADDMAQTLEKFKRNLREIEDALRGVEAKTVQQTQRLMLTQGEDGRDKSEEEQVGELSAVLRYFEDGILSVAGNVGLAREKVLELTTGDVVGVRVKRRTGIY